jgi:hypothetical protein
MFALACTWTRAGKLCRVRSPEVKRAEEMAAHAMAVGWRVWRGRSGVGDDRLLPGEALCPAHRHDPMNLREAPEAALALNDLRAAGMLSLAGEGEKS